MRALAILLLLPACSGGRSTVPPGDGAPTSDLPRFTDGRPVDTIPPVSTIVCSGDCRDYVVSRLVLPTPTTAAAVGIDHDGDGSIDNALAAILGTVASLTGSLDLQNDLDRSVYKGTALLLVRVQAPSFSEANRALAQAWRGAEQTCCDTPDDLAACQAQAQAGCFGGGHAFTPHATSPNSTVLGGSITSGHGRFGPASMALSLRLGDIGELDLALRNVHLLGQLSSTAITGGVIAGVIPKSEVNDKLLPALTVMLNDVLTDPDRSQSTKDLILNLFDSDGNGAISDGEVQANSLITTFLGGDVDVDKDGVKELSLGLSFEAVSAVIDG